MESGIEAIDAPILEVNSVCDTLNRSVRLAPMGAADSNLLGCELALTSAVRTLRFLPGVDSRKVRCGAVRLRRLTRLEFYGRLLAHLLSRQKRENASFTGAVGKLLDVVGKGGLLALAAHLRRTANLSPDTAYDLWIEIRERLNYRKEVYWRRLKREDGQLPTVSLIMVVGEAEVDALADALASVQAQIHDDWELLVAVEPTAPSRLSAFIEGAASKDTRIRLVGTGAETDPAAARNVALGMAKGEWVAVLAEQDTLSPVALAAVACDAVLCPEVHLYYCDDDILGPKGKRRLPRFKPEFSREYLRSTDYMGELLFCRADTLRALGGWRSGFDEALDYDAALRVYERVGAEAIGHLPEVLHHRHSRPFAASKPPAMRRALEEHLQRTGVRAAVEEIPGIDALHLRHDISPPLPLVSLIVPTRDKVELLRGCVESILALTTYRNYEILVVDNDSTDPSTLAYLAELRSTERVRLLSCSGPFNFSRINNFAVGEARGAVVGLLNNDTVVISPDWLTEMVSWAVQPDIGCVGAKLYYADDTIQHAGVLIGVGDVAGHAHRHLPRNHEGYCLRLKVVHNLSAVTAACLVVRKAVYEEIGGLNDRDLAVAYNDVDFCLRVRAAGYSNVWTPFAELYHLESLSRGSDRSVEKARRYADEVAYMHQHWDLRSDPFYSVHLTRLHEDFSIAV
ncbi:MAG: glycosyltransferase [Vicinamibacterales bacterium]